MKRHSSPQFSLGTKIYGLATSILILLVGTTIGNIYQLRRVKQEILEVAEYITPLEKNITTINIHALEQSIHFERLLRLYKSQPLDREQLAAELNSFEQLGELVDQELQQAIALSNDAAAGAKVARDILEFARLEPLLQILAEDHQNLQRQIFALLDLIQQGKTAAALQLEAPLEEREATFNHRVHTILIDLNQFTETTIRQIEIHEQNLLTFNLVLTAIATLTGLTVATIITNRLVKPVNQLLKGAQAVEAGDLDTQVKINSRDEIEILATAFNQMVQDRRQKEQLQQAFGQYVDPRIVKTLVEQPTRGRGHKAMMTVFFSDLAKFSTISEILTPDHLVRLLNQYLTLATGPITDSQGVIDKFIGDAIVAFWGPPFVSEANHAKLACYAALEQHLQLQKLQRTLPDFIGVRKGIPKLQVRVGLDTGELVVGNVGTDLSMSYTAMGRAIDIAEQLETANKRYGTQILLTERTRQLAGEAIETREIDRLPIGDNNTLVPVHELLGYGAALDESTAELKDTYTQGLQAYREENWPIARNLFEACLQLNSHDGPSKFYLQQIPSLKLVC
ncbi:MAG: HAMP domain-containing protein [Cyanothece sp. SIO1E1]|nr:HAMP domain-containing protein [Cyanothece sp. SIO1E1]